MPYETQGAMESAEPEDASEQAGESAADEKEEDYGKSVLIPVSMFPDAKPGDTVTMKIGQVFGEEMEAMPSKKAASEKPMMPMRPSIEDDMRSEMMNGKA